MSEEILCADALQALLANKADCSCIMSRRFLCQSLSSVVHCTCVLVYLSSLVYCHPWWSLWSPQRHDVSTCLCLACALQNLFESATAKISKAARSGGGWKDPFKNAKDTVAEVCATLCVLMLCACTYVDDQYARKRARRCTMGKWA